MILRKFYESEANRLGGGLQTHFGELDSHPALQVISCVGEMSEG